MILAGMLLLMQTQEVQTPAALNAGEWITEDDYPPAALRWDQQGTVAFDLSVDAQGQVSNCVVTQSSESAVLDDSTCRLVTARARFRPARDPQGRQIASHFRSRVRWVLPEPEPVAIANWHAVGVIKVSAEGLVLACEDRSEGAIPKFIGNPCDDFQDGVSTDMLRMIGGVGNRLLTFETAMSFDGSPEPALRYREAGQTGSAFLKVRFEVNESGTIENCERVPTGEERWMTKLPGECTRLSGSFTPRFGPDGKPLRSSGIFVLAISRKP